MKNIRQTKVILEATSVLTKILELLHWIGAASMLVFGVFAIVTRQEEHDALEKLISECGKELSCYGFEMSVADSSGAVNMSAILLFAVAAIMIFSLVAMIFRNIYLIAKKSKNSTPFQADNIRMLKEIGIFSISVPIGGLMMSIIARIVLGVDDVETSVNMYGFTMGVIVLCLTQFFVRGAELEKDVEGLL